VHAAGSSGDPDLAEFREVLGRFATGLTVVTTAHGDLRRGMTVNSLTSVSLDPMLVLFCCQRDAALHEPLLASGRWAVSLLAAGQEDVARWFAVRAPTSVDQFAGYAVVPAEHSSAPLLADAMGWIECRTWATYDGGDHTIVVGEVLGLEAGAGDGPLVYFRSAYRTLAPQR
jgi:flavin reductase (DIM6/NTAB) family NADH-FMN oxidoreductase RutF